MDNIWIYRDVGVSVALLLGFMRMGIAPWYFAIGALFLVIVLIGIKTGYIKDSENTVASSPALSFVLTCLLWPGAVLHAWFK